MIYARESDTKTAENARKAAAQAGMQTRIKFLRRLCVVGFLIVAIYMLTTDIKDNYTDTIISDVFALVSLVVVFALTHVVKKFTIIFHLVLFGVVGAIVYGLFGPQPSRSVFFAAAVPLVGYLLLRRVGGIIWTTVTVLFLLLLYVFPNSLFPAVRLEPQLLLDSALACAILAVLMYMYEGINIRNEQLLAVREQQITSANYKLNEELIKDKKNAGVLEAALEAAEKSNKLLQSNKLALLNVLDDASQLQADLRKEKAGVELKVEERTKELRKQQTRLEASINSIENGFLMTFTDDNKVVYNPALVTILGLDQSFEDAANHGTADAIKYLQKALGDSFDIKKGIKNCLNSRTPFSHSELIINDKYIRLYGTPVIDDLEDMVIGTVILVQDTTEAKVLDRLKDEFMSIASHELRTPLTAIRGNASMLEELYGKQMPTDDAREMLSDIKDSSVRLISIVNQFLTTSRLEQKRTSFDMKPVDIVKSVLYCADELKVMVSEKKLKLTVDLPSKLPLVLADETRTQEVIVNLIGNAIKYTDAGSIAISARAIPGAVQVNVSDTGKGIEAKNHHLLFRKFQQVSTGNPLTRDDSRSTGLGLYITKQLVEQMGGKIYLSASALGKGSTFTFELPIARSGVSLSKSKP